MKADIVRQRHCLITPVDQKVHKRSCPCQVCKLSKSSSNMQKLVLKWRLPCRCHMKVVMTALWYMCRGSRAALQECAVTWYTTPDPRLQALLPCQLYAEGGSSSMSASSYLDLQCSPGYEGRLCSICQPGYGSSGSLLARQRLTCSLNCLLSPFHSFYNLQSGVWSQ